MRTYVERERTKGRRGKGRKAKKYQGAAPRQSQFRVQIALIGMLRACLRAVAELVSRHGVGSLGWAVNGDCGIMRVHGKLTDCQRAKVESKCCLMKVTIDFFVDDKTP